MKYHRHGLTLIDVLIALALLGVFALLAFRLLGANFNLTATTMAANDNSARFDDALARLRADVSDSSSVEMKQDHVLIVHGNGPQITEWRSTRNTLARKSGEKNDQWDVGHPVTLKLDGAVVLLTVDSSEPIAVASIQTSPKEARP